MRRQGRLKRWLIWWKNLARSMTGWRLMLVMLAGCAANTPAPGSGFCLLYRPVYSSDADTPATVEQVVRNNANYDCLCGGEC
ncbi:MAG: hypothetical protein LBO78_03400 [Rickettsiales bacterium]|nr:hypothetical protein [Rickettsiales bacterium]